MTIPRQACASGIIPVGPGGKFSWVLNVWMPHYIWVSENLSLHKHTLNKRNVFSIGNNCHWSWHDEVGEQARNSSAAYQDASSSFLLKVLSVLSPPQTRGKMLCVHIQNSNSFKLNFPRSWIISANVSQYCGTLQRRGFKQDFLKTGIVPSSVQKGSTCKVAIVFTTESVVLCGFLKLVGGKNILATK